MLNPPIFVVFQESDRDSRLEEAMTRLLVTSLMSQSQIPLDDWLNPTEVITVKSLI